MCVIRHLRLSGIASKIAPPIFDPIQPPPIPNLSCPDGYTHPTHPSQPPSCPPRANGPVLPNGRMLELGCSVTQPSTLNSSLFALRSRLSALDSPFPSPPATRPLRTVSPQLHQSDGSPLGSVRARNRNRALDRASVDLRRRGYSIIQNASTARLQFGRARPEAGASVSPTP